MSGAVQLGLFADSPPPARWTIPERPEFQRAFGSSQEAARQAVGSAARLRRAVLAELRIRPGTADEIAARLRRSVLSIRPRVSELRAMKEIIDDRRMPPQRVRHGRHRNWGIAP